MDEQQPPGGISVEEWQATPESVRQLVLALMATIEQLQKDLQKDFDSISDGTKDCVTVKVKYRDSDDFYRDKNFGRVAHKDEEYSIYRFGVKFNQKGVGAGQNKGNWAQYQDAGTIERADNPQEGLRQVYMHELIWHGSAAMNKWGHNKTGPMGDIGHSRRFSAYPLYISPKDKQSIRDAFGMEQE